MKLKWSCCIPVKKKLLKLFMVANLLIVCSLVTVIQVSAKVYSEGDVFSIDEQNITIRDLLDKMEKSSTYVFFYNDKYSLLDNVISVRYRNMKLSDMLEDVLTGTDLDFRILENNIVILVPKELVQKFTVKGKVTDAGANPLPGVNIVEKGTTNGTVSDLDGNYIISISSQDAVLTFSYVGFLSKDVEVAGQTNIDIVMAEDVTSLDEVVVIGYGTQKKENITGSVETASNDQLENKPVISVAQALQGELSGIAIRQQNGKPGTSTDIRIRGYGTFSSAGNAPLVLVDGIPGSIDAVNPSDIKNISVLKDAASAAIYGSRAANGVILITTKRGAEGKMEVSYDGAVGFSELADMPRFVDSWIYAQAYNEALTNAGQGAVYSEEDIKNFMAGTDPDKYPNDKHYEMAFDNIAWQTKHDISMMGGNQNTNYRFSLGYLRNDGLLQNNKYDTYRENLENRYDKYNLRLNIDSEITDKLKLTTNISGTTDSERGPAAATGDRTTMRVVTRVARMPSSIAARTSEGYFGRVDKGSPWADIDANSFELDKNNYFIANSDLEYEIIDGLKMTLRGGYVFDQRNYKKYAADEQIDATTYAGPAKLNVNWSASHELTLEALLKYNKTFGDHTLNALAGYSQIEGKYEYLKAYRDNFPTNELYELNAGSSEKQKNWGGASEWGLISYFSRVQYDYKRKYLMEANVRYDGSSRFDKQNRFGVFPSFSAGWRISEESFVRESLPWVYNLKLRASWGELGNQQIGNYPYQAQLSSGNNAIWGDKAYNGVVMNTVANTDITWETTAIGDIGLDLSLFKGKLSTTIDYFNKNTRDILYGITTAGTLGLYSSPTNAGKVKNTGWDFNVIYRENVGDFAFEIAPHFSFVDTEVLELSDVEKDIGKGLFIGEPLNALYGYTADGLFVDEADVDNYPTQPYNAQPGDIRYKDISGPEGVPDGKVDAEYDRSVIGQSAPKYNYGARISGHYKGFDFSVTLDGAAGMKRYLSNMAGRAFANKSNVQQWMWDNRWTVENPNRDAIYPRFLLHGGGMGEPYSYLSTFWAWDASYLKIRSAQIGYTLPKSVVNALKIRYMRVYLSGRNLFCFDKYFEGWDPELDVQRGEGVHYPMSRTYVFGVNVKF